MLFKKGELKTLWPFYLSYFLLGLSTMIMPFIIIYFRDLNFSFFQISIIIATVAIVTFLFEVPTGALADGYSRKYSVILGFLISAIAIMLIPLTSNFYLILFFWSLAAVGMAFISGAEESWVVDNLNKSNKKELLQEFFIKNKSITFFGAIFAPFLGAMIVKTHSIKILWVIFGLGFLSAAIILSLFAKELFRPKKLKLIKAFKETFTLGRKGMKFIFSHKTIFLLILASVFSYFMAMGNNGWQPLLVNLSMPEYGLGYLYSIMAVVGMIFPFLSRMFKKTKVKNALSILTLIRILVIFSLIFIYPPFFIIASLIALIDDGFYYMGEPLEQNFLHKFIPRKIRATVISSQSMIFSLTIAITNLMGGVFLDIFGPQKVIAFSSLFGVFAIIAYMKIKD